MHSTQSSSLVPDALPTDFCARQYGTYLDVAERDPVAMYDHWVNYGMHEGRSAAPCGTIDAAVALAIEEPNSRPLDRVSTYASLPTPSDVEDVMRNVPAGGRFFIVCEGVCTAACVTGTGCRRMVPEGQFVLCGAHAARMTLRAAGFVVERCYTDITTSARFCVVLRSSGVRQPYLSIVAHHPTAQSSAMLLQNIFALSQHSRVAVVATATGCVEDAALEKLLRDQFPDASLDVLFVPNDKVMLCIGKQRAALRMIDTSPYARVIMANDSVIYLRHLRDFFRLLLRPGRHFGIVDSEEAAYHLPSFLHAFDTEGLSTFVNLVDVAVSTGAIKCMRDLINHVEVAFPADRSVTHALYHTADVCRGALQNVHFNDVAYASVLETGYPIVKARKLRHIASFTGDSSEAIPADFDAETYRALNRDVNHFDDDSVREHYRMCGRQEGRRYSTTQEASVPEYLRAALVQAGLAGVTCVPHGVTGPPRTLVSYSYYESAQGRYNLAFFLHEALRNEDATTFIIVVNGRDCTVPIPDAANIYVILRPNEGFDFGAHGRALLFAATLDPFDRYVFMNCSAIGPFTPAYASHMRWTDLMTSRLGPSIGAVGTSVVTLSATDLCDACGTSPGHCTHNTTRSDIERGAYIEGFCFALDAATTDACIRDGVFTQHASKHATVRNGEYGVSRAARASGTGVASLIYRYQHIDMNSADGKKLNQDRHHSRHKTNGGISLHPFEVLFHKWNWRTCDRWPENVNFEDVAHYVRWRLDPHA